jgi:hypothetical protein
MGDAEQRYITAGEALDPELVRRFVVVVEEVSFAG